MKTTLFLRSLAATACVAVLLQACGADTVAGIDRGGAPVVASGVVTGFGSIFVNGVEYDTSDATFQIGGRTGSEADLRVGYVVTVVGTLDEGSTTRGKAESVSFRASVRGPVEALDLEAGTLDVLGQKVRITDATSFGDGISTRGLAGLSVGTVVEISGFPGSDGDIVATRVELDDGTDIEATGAVSDLDAAAMRFSINALRVDYSQAELEGFGSSGPQNGDTVEVEGTMLDADGVLIATHFEREDGPSFAASERAEIEGLVTRFGSSTDFSVSGQPVVTNSSTVFENGSAADLALDVAVEVEGTVDGQGRLVAEEVEFRIAGPSEISGTVSAVNAADGTLEVSGVRVSVTATTRFEDHSDARVTHFSLANVAVGDYVEVRGHESDDGLIATLLERDDADDSEVEISGIVRSVAAPELVVLGATVVTNAGTQFRDENENALSADAFFAAAPGRRVEIDGEWIGGAIQAEEAQLED